MCKPYKRLQNLATLWGNILAIFVGITGFKIGKLPYFKALFSVASPAGVYRRDRISTISSIKDCQRGYLFSSVDGFLLTVLHQKLKKKINVERIRTLPEK